jgi:hypothetical protein
VMGILAAAALGIDRPARQDAGRSREDQRRGRVCSALRNASTSSRVL